MQRRFYSQYAGYNRYYGYNDLFDPFTEVCMDMDTMDIIVMDIHHISIPQIPWVTGQLSLWEKEKKESLERSFGEAQQC